MIIVNYPEPSFRIRQEDDKDLIFDGFRKLWVPLTDEEWVRQNFLSYLVQVMQYPASVIAIEKEIYVGELKKRFDILVYNNLHEPWLLVECKAASVKLDKSVLGQVLRYGITVPARYVVITNGDTTIGWQKTEAGLELIEKLPVRANN